MVSASNFISGDKNFILSSVDAFLPKFAVIPLCEDDSDFLEVLVSEGSVVKEGDVIAKTRGLYIHSSVPGLVKKIEQRQYSNGKQGLCAIISLGGAFSFLGKRMYPQAWHDYEASTMRFLLKEAGIVNTFSKSQSIYTQMAEIHKTKSDTVVLRLFDSDPSYITESFIAKNYISSVLEGAAILSKAFDAKNLFIAYSVNEKNSLKSEIDAFLNENSKVIFPENLEVFTIGIDLKKYPAGTMHDLSTFIKKNFKDERFSNIGRKDLFVDSTTALNAYNAIIFKKPVLTTFIHVTGECLNSAAILNVRIGTSLRDIVEQCGGFKRKVAKIIVNGIIQGKSLSSLDIPVSCSIKSVEFVPKKRAKLQITEKCIRCGNCRKICPVYLWPGNLYRLAHLESLENASESDKIAYKSAILCTECGLCNSVCPSRIPLSQTISILKDSYNEE